MQVNTTNLGKSLADIRSPGSQLPNSTPTMSQQDFLKLMVLQMQNQNPMEPQDNSQMIAQLASFQTLTAMEEMSTALKALAQVSQLASASSLVGRTVQATVPQSADPKTGKPRPSEQVTGIVSSVTFDSAGAASVHIGNRSFPVAQVQEVR